MSTTTTPTATASAGELRLALDEIRLRENVRELDAVNVESLAQSIALRGLLVPLIVRAVEGGYELVSGYHRFAACRELGHIDVPVVVRQHEGSSADARRRTSRASSSRRLRRRAPFRRCSTRATPRRSGAGPRLEPAARDRAGEDPQASGGRPAHGRDGEIPVSAIDNLLAIAAVSPALAEAVVDVIAAGEVDGSQLVGNAGWAIGRALDRAPKGTFGAYLNSVSHNDLTALRLGKKTDALVAEAEQLHREVDRYAFGPPAFRFAEADVDQARAAGVLIEFEGHGRSTAIITDRGLYRQLAKQAIERTVEDLRDRAATNARGQRTSEGKRERTPREELDAEHRASLRELTRQAHGTNLDLGTALLTELATVAPDDLDVARFFAYGLLGPESSATWGPATTSRGRSRRTGCGSCSTSTARPTTPTLKSGKPGQDEGRLRRRRRRRQVAVALRGRRQDCRRALWPRARRLRRAALRQPARAGEKPAPRIGAAALPQGHRAQGVRARDQVGAAGQPQGAAARARGRGARLQRAHRRARHSVLRGARGGHAAQNDLSMTSTRPAAPTVTSLRARRSSARRSSCRTDSD